MKVSENSEFKSPEPGVYRAVCTRVIDLGTQEGSYNGEPTSARKVMLAWEVDQLMEDGRPFLVSSRYTASLGKKATLRAVLESWRGKAFTDEELKGFDLAKVLGVNGLVNLVKEEKYTNVKGVMPMVKGTPALEPHGPFTHFELDNFSHEVYNSLSDRLKETIAKSPEYKMASTGTPEQPPEGGKATDDIPF